MEMTYVTEYEAINATFERELDIQLHDYATWAYEAAQRFAAGTPKPVTVWTEDQILAAEAAEMAAEATKREAERIALAAKLATPKLNTLTDDELCELAETGNRHADRLLRIRGL